MFILCPPVYQVYRINSVQVKISSILYFEALVLVLYDNTLYYSQIINTL